MPKAYVSNILKVWTTEAQQRLLAQIPGWPESVTVYRDQVKVRARSRRAVDALADRAAMLRPTSRYRAEEIYVAALGVLAWDLRDLGQCLAAASAREATIIALNTGARIGPNAGAGQIALLQADFLADKRRGAYMGRPGHVAAAAAKVTDSKRRAELIRDDWIRGKVPTAQLLARAGTPIEGTKRVKPMAWVTARKYLGERIRPPKPRRAQKENHHVA